MQSQPPERYPQAKKRFGQHFLHDHGVIDRIIAAINPIPGQHIVEIGPGTGALTAPLLARLGTLDVIEMDRDLVTDLDIRLRNTGRLRIHLGDALTFMLSDLADSANRIRVVGNLPYNIATPLLFHFLTQLALVDDMIFMLQREVADRLVAPAGSENYGRLSVMIQYHLQVAKLFDVSPGAFHPPPQVYSSIVRLSPKRIAVPATDSDLFGRLVLSAFAQRRKMLRNSLKNLVSASDFVAANIDPAVRAEVLDVEDFIRLANCVSVHGR